MAALSHNGAILHLEEGLTFAGWIAGLADRTEDKFFLYLNAGAAPGEFKTVLQNLNFEFPKGSTVFYSPGQSDTLGQIFFATSADTASFETRLG